MPSNLTPNTGTFPTQTAPAAGEARTAASVATPFQNSADRTQYVKDRLDNIDPTGTGARRLRYVATFTALRAVTDLTDDAVIVVDGYGLYIYDAASAVSEVEPLVIKPTSVGGGSGRWIFHAYSSLDVANGLAKLDSNGRVATTKLAASGGGAKILGASVVNGIVGIFTTTVAGPVNTASTSYVDVAGSSFSFTLEVGDIVEITGQAFSYQATTPLSHWTQWLVTKPDTSTATVAASEMYRFANYQSERQALAIGTFYAAVAAGSHSFKLQHRLDAGGAGGTVSLANLNVIAKVIRP